MADLKPECNHSHNDICEECENDVQCLDSFYESVLYTTDSTEREEMLYDLNSYVLVWMCHIIRSAQTQYTKSIILEELTDSSCFLIGDWMMKILPQYFREKIEDCFGKTGISGHVHSFIMRSGTAYRKADILHIS